MAEDIVIRIEDLAAMEREAPAIDPSAAQSSSAATSSPEITMESLFGPDPWWREPSFLQSLGELGNRIEYPTAIQPTMEDDCPCAEYFLSMIDLLEDIDASIGAMSITTINEANETGPASNSGIGAIHQLQQSITGMLASINAAQMLNNPINAGANMARSAGTAIGQGVSTIVAAGATTLLASLGSMAGPIGTIIGTVAGSAVQLFFSTLSDGIKSFFDYLEHTYAQISMFSSEMIGARIDRDLRLLSFRIDTAQNYGDQFADIYSAQTDLILALERLKLELFQTFGPTFETGIRLLTYITRVLSAIAQSPMWDQASTALPAIVTALDGIGMFAPIIGPLKALLQTAQRMEEVQEKERQRVLGQVTMNTAAFFGWEFK